MRFFGVAGGINSCVQCFFETFVVFGGSPRSSSRLAAAVGCLGERSQTFFRQVCACVRLMRVWCFICFAGK